MSLDNIDALAVFSMAVSLTAMVIQLVFGVLSLRRSTAETQRQIAETKKQERLLAFQTEEQYKNDVRNWGRQVVDSLSMAQQLCAVDPKGFISNDYLVTRAQTVAKLRGLLNRAKWLFPSLATPSYEDQYLIEPGIKELSALEAILYGYHTLDSLSATDPDKRKAAAKRVGHLRNEFVREMRRAVDPQVRGEDIQNLIVQAEAEILAAEKEKKEASETA